MSVERLEFHALYFGGGTPSVLPARMLREVFTAIDQRLRWHRVSNRSIELDPALVNADKVQAMVDHGFHRFSFGVQTTDKAINELYNRGPQGPEMIRRCLELLPASAGTSVTADVLLGLQGVTPADTLRDLERLLSHPRRPVVDLFHLTPTDSYVAEHFGGDDAAAAAALDRYDADFDAAVEALCRRAAYGVARGGSHHCRSLHPGGVGPLMRARVVAALRAQKPWLASLRSQLRVPEPIEVWRLLQLRHRRLAYTQFLSEVREPFNLMGLGPSARSQVFSRVAVQARPHAGEGGPTTYVGSPVDGNDELRSFLLFEVRDRGEVQDLDLTRIFGTTLEAALPMAVGEWQRMGLVQRTRTGWGFARDGRSSIAQDMLWAVPEGHLEALLARKSQRKT